MDDSQNVFEPGALSRRGFLKGSAVAAVSAGALSSLVACAPSSPAPKEGLAGTAGATSVDEGTWIAAACWDNCGGRCVNRVLVRDGEVVMGSHGFAGEIGHLSVAMDGPLCSCGRHGCLEAFAGRRALVEAAGIAEDGDATSSEAIDMFLQRWRAGDSDVAKVVDQAADALVSAIASAVNLVDVDTVLLGGLWTHFGDELATVLEGRLRSEILGYPNVKIRVFVPPVALHPSLYGAAEMGLRRFIENPLGYMGEK